MKKPPKPDYGPLDEYMIAAWRMYRLFARGGQKAMLQRDEKTKTAHGGKIVRQRRRKNQLAKASRLHNQQASAHARRKRQKRRKYAR